MSIPRENFTGFRRLFTRMKLLVLFCLLIAGTPHLAGADAGGRADYVGGTLASLDGNCSGRIITSDSLSMIFDTKDGPVRVPYEKINLLEYGQKVDRRYAMAVIASPMLLLSKKRQHFLTVGYQDDDGHQQAMILRIHKKDVRAVLVSLEARTGLKIQFQDDEARKAGKG